MAPNSLNIEHHPFGEFIPKGARGIIVGSFPIGKFTDPSRKMEIKSHEFSFFFGGEKNLLWKLIAHARDKRINNQSDIEQMLSQMKLGVGDVIKSCRRKNGSASDADLYDIEFNTELLDVIKRHKIKTILFTSKKVEVWFRRLFPEAQDLHYVSLISPSAQTLRSVGRNGEFQAWKLSNPGKSALDFLYDFYGKVFRDCKF